MHSSRTALSRVTLATLVAAGIVSSSSPLVAQSPFPNSLATAAQSAQSNQLDAFTEPYRDIQIGAADTGTISELRVEEGKPVRFGQIVAKLDDRVMQANVTVARQAAASQGELEVAQIQLEGSQRRFDQLAALHGRNHASDQELLAVGSARDEAQARLNAFHELNARRQQELKQAEAQLARMTLTSPIDGVVLKCLKDVGEVVSPADPAVLRIVQLDPLRVTASATIAQAQRLRVGQTTTVHLGDSAQPAVVEAVSPVADVSSGTTTIHLRLSNPGHVFMAGVPCVVDLPTTTSSPAASVPLQTQRPGSASRYE